MTSGKVFFIILAVAYLALFVAAVAPASPLATTVGHLVRGRTDCSAGWLRDVVRYKTPRPSEPAPRKRKS